MEKPLYLARSESAAPVLPKFDPMQVYDISFREPGGTSLKAKALDSILYPKTLAWIRLLNHDMGRRAHWEDEAGTWRAEGRRALLELAESGLLGEKEVLAFISAAARSGIVEVEMPWEHEDKGWAARLFPWETLLSLATQEERPKNCSGEFNVVRVLRNAKPKPASGSGVRFIVTAAASERGFDYNSECAAICASLQEDVEPEFINEVEELSTQLGSERPRILHLVLDYQENQGAERGKRAQDAERISRAVADTGVEMVVFSSCHTGGRLAPLTVAKGVKFAMGFQGKVADACLPVFFGAFYRSWKEKDHVLSALRAGRMANAAQGGDHNLGVITLWSAESLIAGLTPPSPSADKSRLLPRGSRSQPQGDVTIEAAADLKAALPITCELEDSLNYSVLHNRTGGLFKRFIINKVKSGMVAPVEVTVTLDAGVDRPADCRFFFSFNADLGRVDLAERVVLPLGAGVLRQRGETVQGTVQIIIRCGEVQFFHHLQSIRLLPCDEWRDDGTGRHLLPSFVFPRDPAVREILSAAQPFLRALSDCPTAGFDGYQAGFHPSALRAVIMQTRALWSALQYTLRLDYVSPPPAYTRRSQRLRTPEEVLRSRRATCIETSLLMASCWEHVGIHPVLFLVRNHAFAGCWLDQDAWRAFLVASIQQAEQQAVLAQGATPPTADDIADDMTAPPIDEKKTPWMFREAYHLQTIRSEIEKGALVPLETTFIPLQRPYSEAVFNAEDRLNNLPLEQFDGMVDVQTAREQGVTPLSIIHHGFSA